MRARFEQLAAVPGRLGVEFYRRLFLQFPESEALFTTSPEVRIHHLEAGLSVVLRNLDALDLLTPALESLAAVHAKAGVSRAQLLAARDLVIASARHLAGETWREVEEHDWREALDAMLTIMLAAGADAEFEADEHDADEEPPASMLS